VSFGQEAYTASRGEMIRDCWTGSDLEGSDDGLIEVISSKFPGAIEDEGPQSGQPVSRPTFEPSTS
jgi:hypothetical protein